MAAALPIVGQVHRVDRDPAVAKRQWRVNPIGPLIHLHIQIGEIQWRQVRGAKLKGQRFAITLVLQPIRMMLLIPRNRMREVIDRNWDVGGVVDTDRQGRVIRSPNHVDDSGLNIGVRLEIVEDHLEMNVLRRSRKQATASRGFRGRSQQKQRKAGTGKSDCQTNDHRTPPAAAQKFE